MTPTKAAEDVLVERQFSTGAGSYEAPNGIIHYRVDCRDLAAVLRLARAALTREGDDGLATTNRR